MEILTYIIISSFIVSLVSFSGAILFISKERKINKYMILFVAVAAGSFLATAFFNLIPESFQNYSLLNNNSFFIPSYFILLGILFFYIIEKFIFWHHHHDVNCHKHSLSTLSLVGDGFHNFIDGILITTTFLTDINLGIITTIAIMLHEIPQEISDLAILLHSGFSKFKALFWNFMSALLSLVGALFSYIFFSKLENILPLLIAFTAGCFIYIALADIVPELKNKTHNFNQFIVSIFFILGILLVFSLTLLIPA